MDYHTWVCPIFILEDTLKGDLSGLPKWEPRSGTGVYLGNSPFNARSVALILNIKTRHIYHQYHVNFDDTFSTVYHTRKFTVPVNRKNLV